MGTSGKRVVLNFRVSEETRERLQARADRDHEGNVSAAVRATVDAAELLDGLRETLREVMAEGGALDGIEVYSLLLFLGGEQVRGLAPRPLLTEADAERLREAGE
jgi:hypothetical protein